MAVDTQSFDEEIAIGEYGTQLFWWNKTSMKFEYALPLVSGGEYGGETETFEAPELDLDYVPKISGRTTLEDITLTSNYTKDRYLRWLEILSNTKTNAYMEVYSDGSATVFGGKSGRPTIQGGDVRQIEVTIAPENMIWVDNIKSVTNLSETNATLDEINALLGFVTGETYVDLTANSALPIDNETLPNKRVKFFRGTDDSDNA